MRSTTVSGSGESASFEVIVRASVKFPPSMRAGQILDNITYHQHLDCDLSLACYNLAVSYLKTSGRFVPW